MKRCGQMIAVKPDKLEEYKELHKAVWPEVLKTIKECNIRNYSIYFGENFLFAYFEYIGINYDADMSKMEADEMTQKWWAITKPCHTPLESRKEGAWWSDMEEVFHVY